MIKIETSYENNTDDFIYKYDCKNSHTMEHLCLIAKLVKQILKNQKDIDLDIIFKMVRDILEYDERSEKSE